MPPLSLTHREMASSILSVGSETTGPRLRVAETMLMMPTVMVSLVTPTSEAKFVPLLPGTVLPGLGTTGGAGGRLLEWAPAAATAGAGCDPLPGAAGCGACPCGAAAPGCDWDDPVPGAGWPWLPFGAETWLRDVDPPPQAPASTAAPKATDQKRARRDHMSPSIRHMTFTCLLTDRSAAAVKASRPELKTRGS